MRKSTLEPPQPTPGTKDRGPYGALSQGPTHSHRTVNKKHKVRNHSLVGVVTQQ